MRIFLHISCHNSLERIIKDIKDAGHHVTGYYYNPNVRPCKEYEKRLEKVKKITRALGVDLIEGDYDSYNWDDKVRGNEYTLDGGDRCEICLTMRFKEAYKYFLEDGTFDLISTTLCVDPEVDGFYVKSYAEQVAKNRFFFPDVYKSSKPCKGSVHGRRSKCPQRYCGCIFSKMEVLSTAAV